MMLKTVAAILATSLIVLSGTTADAQDDHAGMDHAHPLILGHVTFANSGNQAAQKPFLEGLALIHSFEYDRAVAAFQKAEKADPSFALAYWMEALTNTLGLSRAQAAAGDSTAARATRHQLTRIWIHADPEVRALLTRGAISSQRACAGS